MSEPAGPETAPAPAPEPEPAKKKSLKERLQAHMAEYGALAVYTYLALSLLTIAGFSIAIGIGVSPSTATGVLGVIGAGWAAAKITLPLRVLATLALTPLVATVVRRKKPKSDDAETAPDDLADETASKEPAEPPPAA